MILREGSTGSMKTHCIPVAITLNIDTEMNKQFGLEQEDKTSKELDEKEPIYSEVSAQ